MVSNQQIGLKCLNIFLTHKHAHNENQNCFAILKSNGYDQFIFIKLRHMLHKTEQQTFDLLMENLNIILLENIKSQAGICSFDQSSKNLKSILETDHKLEDVFVQLVDNLTYCQSDSVLTQKHLEAMRRYMFPLMKCNLIKYTKSLLHSIDELLARSQESGQYKSIQICLLVLYDFLSLTNVDISCNECATILSRMIKMVIKMHLDNIKDQEIVVTEIGQIVARLEMASSETIKKTIAQFCAQTIKTDIVWKVINDANIKPEINQLDLVSFFARNARLH